MGFEAQIGKYASSRVAYFTSRSTYLVLLWPCHAMHIAITITTQLIDGWLHLAYGGKGTGGGMLYVFHCFSLLSLILNRIDLLTLSAG